MHLFRRYTTSNINDLLDDFFTSSPITEYTLPRIYKRDRWIPVNDSSGRLEIELAGHSKDDIEVYSENNTVSVSVKDNNNNSSRRYHRTWPLGEYEVVKGVKYENGLLSIEISKVVPDEKKRNYFKIE